MNTEAVLRLLQEVADQVITPRFRALTEGQVAEKNPGDLVTVADHEAEVLITRALRTAYPGAVVLGEEAHSADPALLQEYTGAEHAFTVDPVDGTKNFVHGSPDHAVMVAEVRSGQTVRSWIWQPQHRLGYVAELGGGAWRTSDDRAPERLIRPPVADPKRPCGVTSRRRWVGRPLGDLPPLEPTWVCCGVDYPKLVEGATDYVVYGTVQPWDHTPGALLLTEAGGVVGTLDGRPYQPQQVEQPKQHRGLLPAADQATYDLVQPHLA